MTRIWIGVLLLAIGCSRASSPSGLSETGQTDSNSAVASSNSIEKASSSSLSVGSPAPPLKLGRFLKGEPVAALESGKVYVLEFWATWCGPCIDAMPHVSDLQAKYPQVTFIGVNVWDEDEAAVQFVKENGKKFKYRFARDDIPKGGDRNDGAMAKTWLAAADIGSIPTAIVVDAQGRIASIGHPMELDECLPQIISGKWDLDAAAKQRLLSVLPQRKKREFNERMNALRLEEPTDETPAELDRIAVDFPEQAGLLGLIKFRVLALADGKAEQALVTGRALLKGDSGNNPQMLNAMAWEVVAPERPKRAADELIAFALEVAKKTDELVKKKNPAVADTLARALFVNGDVRGAIDVQRRAIELASSNPRFAEMVAELQKHLDDYEEAGTAGAAAKPE